MHSLRSVLVVSFTHIGDAVLSTCVVGPLRRAFPAAHLTFLVGERAAPILAGDPQVDALVPYSHDSHAGLAGKWRLLQELRARRFGLVVDLRDAPYTRLLGARRIGCRRQGRRHAVHRYLEALARAGIATDGARPRLCVTDAERRAAARWLAERGLAPDTQPLIAVHPGGGWPYKLWPAERFADVADGLAQTHGARALVFVGPGEAPLADRLCRAMRHPVLRVENVPLRMLAALIQACRLFVGNDSGPMHIADAVGTRIVALFEPTDDIRSGPFGSEHVVVRSAVRLRCNPCHPGRRPGGCGKGFCEPLYSIRSPEVVEAARRQLDRVAEGKRYDTG